MSDEKKTISKKLNFELYETDAIKEYLEDMALKGWQLKDIDSKYVFEECEPQKLIYSVVIFEKKQAKIIIRHPN